MLIEHCHMHMRPVYFLSRNQWQLMANVKTFNWELTADMDASGSITHYGLVIHLIWCLWNAVNSPKNPHKIHPIPRPLKQASIAHFAFFAKDGLFWFGIVTSPQSNLWRVTWTRGTDIMTSYLLIVLAGANWRKGYLHLWVTTVNIDFPPSCIHGLECYNGS